MKSTNGSNGTDLSHRPMAELMALKAEVDAAIAQKREAQKRVTQQLIELAQREGFDAKELLGMKWTAARFAGSAKKTHKRHKPAKYRDPSDPKRTWSGYGKTPGWLIDLTKGGKATRDQFLVR